MDTFLNAFNDSLESDFSTQSIYLFIYLLAIFNQTGQAQL